MHPLIKTAGILKEITLQFLWFLFFANAFSCFVRIPAKLLVDVITTAFLAFLLIHYIYEWYRGLRTGKLKRITLIMIPLIIIPVICAIQAVKVFGQPPLYGFLAQRQVFYALCAHFVVTACERNWVTMKDLERYLMRSFIVLLFIFLFFYVFVNPAKFIDTEFVTLSANKGYRYEFPDTCIYGLFLYALFKVWNEKKFLWWSIVGLSAIYIVVYLLDRTQLIALIGTVGLYVLLNFRVVRMVKLVLGAIAGLTTVIILASLVAPDFFARNIKLYVSAYETITGEKVTESSANIRFLESKIAMAGFLKHPVLGVGFLSGRWNDGFRSISRYFYPTDVGLLGNLYAFGIIGTLLFYIPFILAFIYRRKTELKYDTLFKVAQYFFIFLFVDMLTAATNQKFFGVITVFFGILYYYRYHVTEETEISELPA